MKAATEYLREIRRGHLERAGRYEDAAKQHERKAENLRANAVTLRKRAMECGHAVMALEGDDADLDLPADHARHSMSELL